MKKLATLLVLSLACCAAMSAQTFSLTTGREPVTSLDGLWRFHPGDNPAWADPRFDDSQWPLLRSDEDWGKQGYLGLKGLAWYRLKVVLPGNSGPLSLLLPRILTNYEVYADGVRIGGCGVMPPHPEGRFCTPAIFALPPETYSSAQTVTIALRVWQQASWSSYNGGGPSGTSFLGATPLLRATLQSKIDAYIHSAMQDYILVLLETLGGLVSMALFLFRRREREYLWFGCMMLLEAAVGANGIHRALHGAEIRVFYRYQNVLSVLSLFAAVAFYFRLLRGRRSWLLFAALAGLTLVAAADLLFSFPHGRDYVRVPVIATFGSLAELPYVAWVLALLLRRSKERLADARLLLAPVLMLYVNSLVRSIIQVSFQFGWQHRMAGRDLTVLSQPFPVNSESLASFLFLIAMLAILVNRFARTRRDEERYASEFEAARSVQQFLIPEHLPQTPGLSIQSEYRPAREVGGDFFQVLPHETDRSTLIVVGDVAGHGMESGMLATLIVGAIRTAAAFTTDPARILALLNERMQGRGLATCLALRIQSDGSAVLANAGHLPPYLNGHELAIEGALPLGAIPGIEFPVFDFHLADRDALTLMTDGVAEAQDAEGRLFGFERIGEMLRKGVNAAELATAAQQFGQEDDITVLTVRSAAATT